MTNEELQELKDDIRREIMEEVYEEQRIRIDLDYAYEKLGLDDVYDAVTDLANRMADYDHDVSASDVLDKLEEI